MLYLGRYAAGDSVFYGHNFFDPATGDDIDPMTPAARIRSAAGTWSALSAPSKQDSKTGFYGGTVDTTGYANGQYVIRVTGDPVSGITQSGLFCFEIGPASAIKKNVQLASFPFVMFDATDHVTPKTGLTVTAQRSIDGAAFAACANAVAEVSNGAYKITLAASDLNGTNILLKFTATGADPRHILIVTQS